MMNAVMANCFTCSVIYAGKVEKKYIVFTKIASCTNALKKFVQLFCQKIHFLIKSKTLIRKNMVLYITRRNLIVHGVEGWGFLQHMSEFLVSGLWEITNIGCPFYWILRGG